MKSIDEMNILELIDHYSDMGYSEELVNELVRFEMINRHDPAFRDAWADNPEAIGEPGFSDGNGGE